MATEGELIVRLWRFCRTGLRGAAREGELTVLTTEGELLIQSKGKGGGFYPKIRLFDFLAPKVREGVFTKGGGFYKQICGSGALS